MITTLRGGPGPSSWLQLPVSHELESAKIERKGAVMGASGRHDNAMAEGAQCHFTFIAAISAIVGHFSPVLITITRREDYEYPITNIRGTWSETRVMGRNGCCMALCGACASQDMTLCSEACAPTPAEGLVVQGWAASWSPAVCAQPPARDQGCTTRRHACAQPLSRY